MVIAAGTCPSTGTWSAAPRGRAPATGAKGGPPQVPLPLLLCRVNEGICKQPYLGSCRRLTTRDAPLYICGRLRNWLDTYGIMLFKPHNFILHTKGLLAMGPTFTVYKKCFSARSKFSWWVPLYIVHQYFTEKQVWKLTLFLSNSFFSSNDVKTQPLSWPSLPYSQICWADVATVFAQTVDSLIFHAIRVRTHIVR